MLESSAKESLEGGLVNLTGDSVMLIGAHDGPQRCELLRFLLVALSEELDGAVTVKSMFRSVL